MYNNFSYIRQKTQISQKTIAKLLNISVYTYIGYENNRLVIPEEILIMFGKLYDIPTQELICHPQLISKATENKLNELLILDDAKKECKLIKNLTGDSLKKLSYRKIKLIKENIINEIKN